MSNIILNEEVLETKEEEKEVENKEVENNKNNGIKNKKIIIGGIVIFIIILIVLVCSTIFALINNFSETIVNNVYINGVDVSGLTKEEAIKKLNQLVEIKLNNKLTIYKNDYNVSFPAEEVELGYNVEEAVQKAYEVGRQGSIFKDNYKIINTYFNKENIDVKFSYKQSRVNEIIELIFDNMPNRIAESGYYIEENNLIISKGMTGEVIEVEKLNEEIANAFTDIKLLDVNIEIPIAIKEPEKINVEKLHNEVYKAPKNAYYTKDPFTVYPSEEGIDFDASIEEINEALNNDTNQVIVPLKTLYPEVTTNQIGTEAFPDLLATYDTTFSVSNRNRTTNIRLASEKVDGVVLMPGQEFSYNEVVGKRTAAAGFKSAPVYVSGRVENGIGGGICQVSSTLYNTALRANLEIIKRSNHMFATGYVPLSTDATVSWGGPEFIFKNSRKYPIKIVSKIDGGKITVDIYGCKEEVEYDVEIKSETIGWIGMKTSYRLNTNLAPGTQKKVQSGHGGYKSRAYRILRLNGEVVDTQLLSTDTYAQLETIIEYNE